MSRIEQIEPNDIFTFLKQRISSTNHLWENKSDEIDQEQILYFKYYFDFSTAIEACLRGIVFELSKKEKIGEYIGRLGAPYDERKSYFLDCDTTKTLISEESFNSVFVFKDFKDNYLSLVNFITINDSLESSMNYSYFIAKYSDVRNQRNKLAHGIKSFDGLSLTSEDLRDFILVFYIIMEVYKTKYNASKKNNIRF